jgi:hypothetical protein
MDPQQPYQQTNPHQVSGQHGYPQQGPWQQPPAGLPTKSHPPPTYQQQWPPYPHPGLSYGPPEHPRPRRRWKTVLILTVLGVTIIGLIGIAAAVARTNTTPVASSPTSAPPRYSNAPAYTPAATAAPNPPAPSGPPRAITARDWLKIAKDPEAHKGEAIIVYGQVRQFDSATGTDTFRASVDGVVHKPSYGYVDYETNTVLTSPGGAELGDLVQDDLFKAEVVVAGSLSYDTQIGGSTTVPLLLVTKITGTGTAK